MRCCSRPIAGTGGASPHRARSGRLPPTLIGDRSGVEPDGGRQSRSEDRGVTRRGLGPHRRLRRSRGLDARRRLRCELDGDVRILQTMGIEIHEQLKEHDDDARRIAYSVVKSPMPLEHHLATITVVGGRRRVHSSRGRTRSVPTRWPARSDPSTKARRRRSRRTRELTAQDITVRERIGHAVSLDVIRPPGSTRIFTCSSGRPSASNAAGTPSMPHVPVIIGVTSISPSAIARNVSPNSNGS